MAEIAPRRELVELLRASLREAGFDWRAAAKAPLAYPWERPPFFTGLELNGVPLQPHVAQALPVDIEDTVDAYERFLGGYVYAKRPDNDSVSKLGRSLGMSLYAARQMFTPSPQGWTRVGSAMNAVQVAALVAFNFDGAVVGEGDATFAVHTDRFAFGVEEGRVLSNINRKLVRPISKLRVAGSLLSSRARGLAAFVDKPTLFDTCRLWVEQNFERLAAEGGRQLPEALQMALRVVWWRNAGRFPDRLKALLFKGASPEALHGACNEARGYEGFESPLKTLSMIFVPQFMTSREFAVMFGTVTQPLTLPIPNRTKMKWEASINELDPML